MIKMNIDSLQQKLIDHEGLKHYAYTDSFGNITIGVGRNLSKNSQGLSTEEIIILLNNDILRCRNQLSNFEWYSSCDPIRQDVLTELCFNVGYSGFMKFKNLISNVTQKNWNDSSQDLLASSWANQVGEVRSKDMANRLRTGMY